MMMKLICMVNGMRLQNPSPNACAVCSGVAPSTIADHRDDHDRSAAKT
jgi:hypothetical protein